MINQTRRTLLKSLAYGSALSFGGLSSTVMALKQPASHTSTPGNALPSCDITIFQHQTQGKETVTLMNLTDDKITLDSITPVNLEHINGSIRVKLNNIPEGTLSIAAGERLSFEVVAISTAANQAKAPHIPNVLAGQLKITSDHPAFNGYVPVTVFDNQTT